MHALIKERDSTGLSREQQDWGQVKEYLLKVSFGELPLTLFLYFLRICMWTWALTGFYAQIFWVLVYGN